MHLTPEGLRRLREELRELVEVRRPGIVQRVARARSEGDLSENFAYHDARRELGMLDGRVQTIEGMLRNVQLVEAGGGDLVALGSTVVVEDDFGVSTYTVVGPAEADVQAGRISMVSPLGQALMGRRAGERVGYQSPGGERTAVLREVR